MNTSRLPAPMNLDPFDELFRGWLRPMRWEGGVEPPAIRIDVHEKDGAYTVRADVPGVRKEDVQVNLDGRQVSISAEVHKQSDEKQDGRVVRTERSTGYATRTFLLDHEVDRERASAKLEEGVLTLTLPKKQGTRSGRIPIA